MLAYACAYVPDRPTRFARVCVKLRGTYCGTMTEAVITDPTAIRLLADENVRRFLEPFMGRSTETATAAREVGVSVEEMAYRVGRFRRVGLLRSVGERRHAGRPVTTWSADDAFRCPMGALPEGELSMAFSLVDEPGRRAFHEALARAAVRHEMLDWDLRVYRQDDQVLVSISPSNSDWVPGDHSSVAPAVVLSWVPLALSAEQASILQRRLLEVLEGFEVASQAPNYLCGLFMTPLDTDRARSA